MGETVRADFSQLQRLLEDLETAVGDVSRVMPVLAEVLVGQVQEVFNEEGAVGGNPKWPNLADSTKRARARRQPAGGVKRARRLVRAGEKRLAAGKQLTKAQKAAHFTLKNAGLGGYKILQDTAVLVGSISPDHGDGFVQAWTNVKYAKFHISKAPRKQLPLRDFFAIDQEEWVDEAADTIIAALLGRI